MTKVWRINEFARKGVRSLCIPGTSLDINSILEGIIAQCAGTFVHTIYGGGSSTF